MHKNIHFGIAAGWTALIAFLCLAGSADVPGIKVPNADKYVHAAFYFVFILLWYKGSGAGLRTPSKKKRLVILLICSVIFGCMIEVAQKLFTEHRHAELNDVLANLGGALLGAVALIAYWKIKHVET